MQLAPIALFVFNRPEHARKTIAALAANELAKDSVLYIFSDGVKHAAQSSLVEEVRTLISQVKGFKEVRLVVRDQNYGLARNITEGVSTILTSHSGVIVLEDDLITAPNFLEFMNSALEKYAAEKMVCSITGYSYTDDVSLTESTYFLKLTSSWSWATWADRWPKKLLDDQILQQILSNSANYRSFNFDHANDYVGMIEQQLNRQINSWAIYWNAFNFVQHKVTLYPAKRLVQNIGFDGSGTHPGHAANEVQVSRFDFKLTNDVLENDSIRAQVAASIKSKQTFKSRMTVWLKRNRIFPCYEILRTAWLKTFNQRNKMRLLFYKKKVGDQTYIDPSVNVYGWKHVAIGVRTVIGEDTWLNVNNRILNVTHIDIGDYVYIGRRNLVSSGKKIKICDYVMTANDCKFLASDHDFSDPSKPYISTGMIDYGEQVIEPNAWIGAGAIVLGAITVGRGSIVGAGSVVTKSIPPFSIAVGNPCRVKKRYSFKTKEWILAENFGPDDEASLPTIEEYLRILQRDRRSITIPHFAASSSFGDLLE